MRGNNIALEVPLFAAADVGEGSLVQRAYDGTAEMAGGWIRRAFSKILKN
jgi:D-alanyl-D-alanine carboxypeptidase (penicillin-binding protein 5/6)